MLKDGSEVNALMVIKIGTDVRIKTETGEFRTIPEKDIEGEMADEKVVE